MFCTNCGSPVKDTDNFCTACGSSMNTPVRTPATDEPAAPVVFPNLYSRRPRARADTRTHRQSGRLSLVRAISRPIN